MNVVCLVGRLTADTELKQTPTGTNVCTFCLAVQSNQKKPDGTYKTNFINCVAWRATAEFITNYFRRGQNIGINGTIETRQYQEKDTGKSRTVFEVIVNNTYFVESKNSGNGQSKVSPSIEYTAPAVQQPQQQSLEPQKQSRFAPAALDDFSNIASDDGDLPF